MAITKILRTAHGIETTHEVSGVWDNGYGEEIPYEATVVIDGDGDFEVTELDAETMRGGELSYHATKCIEERAARLADDERDAAAATGFSVPSVPRFEPQTAWYQAMSRVFRGQPATAKTIVVNAETADRGLGDAVVTKSRRGDTDEHRAPRGEGVTFLVPCSVLHEQYAKEARERFSAKEGDTAPTEAGEARADYDQMLRDPAAWRSRRDRR